MGSSKTFHDEEFEDSTKLKLALLKANLEGFLPVALRSSNRVEIYDFFSGPGQDASGFSGSPKVILEAVRSALDGLRETPLHLPQIKVVFNDSDTKKVEILSEVIKEFTNQIEVEIFNCDFHILINKFLSDGRFNANCFQYLFLDQFGIKEVTREIFLRLTKIPRTDLLFFFSSSHVYRFWSTPEFRKILQLEQSALEKVGHTDIHRFVTQEYYGRMVPDDQTYYLAPFSLKKGSNIYGLIFGTSSLKGLEKFLEACWRYDNVGGQANFNIDGDWTYDGDKLDFEEFQSTSKQQKFEEALLKHINGGTATNESVYALGLQRGFLPKHVGEYLKKLQKSGQLKLFSSDGKVARSGAFYLNDKQKRIFSFKWINTNAR